MSICVCAKCKKPWKGPGSPARCPNCGEVSFAIAIQIGLEAISATQSVVKPPTAKKLGQKYLLLQRSFGKILTIELGRLLLIQANISHLRLRQKYLRRV